MSEKYADDLAFHLKGLPRVLTENGRVLMIVGHTGLNCELKMDPCAAYDLAGQLIDSADMIRRHQGYEVDAKVDSTIVRYQRCAQRLWELFGTDPLPTDHPAQSSLERLEALLDGSMLTPARDCQKCKTDRLLGYDKLPRDLEDRD